MRLKHNLYCLLRANGKVKQQKSFSFAKNKALLRTAQNTAHFTVSVQYFKRYCKEGGNNIIHQPSLL